MPDPSDYDDEGDFVSACIKARQDEHPEEDTDQSAAVCYSMWSDKAMTDQIIRKTNTLKMSGHDAEGMEFILSDATPDRYDDTIDPGGWVLENFNRNPIALFNHNSDFPVGRWEKLGVDQLGLRGWLRMAPAGTSPRHDEIRALVDAGILKAVSVGFMPIESQSRKESNRGGVHYSKQELVETSLVSVPANPNALAVAKSLKISDGTMNEVFGKHAWATPIVRDIVEDGTTAMWQGRRVRVERFALGDWRGQKLYRY